MKAKHWAYIGVALIAGNACFLRVSRAAESGYFAHFSNIMQPGFFWLEGVRPEGLFVRAHAPEVTIRLFSQLPQRAFWLKSPAAFLVSGRQALGPLYISLQEGQILVRGQQKFQASAKQITILSKEGQPIRIKTAQAESKVTRGELTFRLVKGQLQLINILEVEDYVKGVLEPELGSLQLPPEVLKAQIVAARSYVLSMRLHQHPGAGYEFCDTPHCQMFGGVLAPHPKFDHMMQAVRGEYLSYHGRPIAAFYHHNCGGATSAVEDIWPVSPQPYLQAVKESPTSACRLAAYSQWRLTLNRRSLAACFRRAGWIGERKALDGLRVVKMDRSERAQQILVESDKPLWVPVDRFRHAVNQYYGSELLKSAVFTIAVHGDLFVFQGRGWGHGVGLCQEGAKSLARQGQTYQQILQHYYPHTKIDKLK